MRRKGLGKGLGQGYKNLLPMDSHIHSLSAKGIKSTTRLDAKSKTKMVCPRCGQPMGKIVFETMYGQKYCSRCRDKEMGLDATGQDIENEMKKRFTDEELDVLSRLNLEYYPSQNIWSIPRGQEVFFVETQLGVSRYKANKLIEKYLDTLENFSKGEVDEWLELDMGLVDYEDAFPSPTKGMKLNARALIIPEDRAVRLEVEQAITVPSTKDGDKPISRREFKRRVDEVQDYLSRTFGGETSIKGQGGYISEKTGKLIEEPVQVVTSFADDKGFSKKQKELIKKLREWRKEWGQESVAYQLEDDLYIITG